MTTRKSMLNKKLHKASWQDNGMEPHIMAVYEECTRRRDFHAERNDVANSDKWQDFLNHMDDVFYGQNVEAK